MLITPQMITQKSRCRAHIPTLQFVAARFPEGAELQTILDACAEAGDTGCAMYLLDQFGDVQIPYLIDDDKKRAALFVAGHLCVTRSLQVDSFLVASKSITVNGSIKAGNTIMAAGGNLHACGCIVSGGSIRAMRDITAGGDIKAKDYILAADGGISTAHEGGASGSLPVCMGDIEAGRTIFAGRDIEALDHVKAGDNYFIFAGVHTLADDGSPHGIVRSRFKPERLSVGTWRPHESND